jgi:membrane-associated phospholipid phosphatase
MGALLGVFLSLSLKLMINIQLLILLLILLSGLVGFSRLKLNMHGPAQVYVGFFVGLLVMLFPFLFL